MTKPISTAHRETRNGAMIPIHDVPRLSFDEFRRSVVERVGDGALLSALFARPSESPRVLLHAVLADPARSTVVVCATELGERYASLTPECPQAHMFEREIAEQWGVVPVGHPWLKPLRFHATYALDRDAWGRPVGARDLPGVLPASADYFRVEGREVHEVAVGPVHAGVIEPGHFRFQCHGEDVFHLEIELGYQHRGVERRLIGGPDRRTLHYLETLAGDSSIGHALAYCQAVEALAGRRAPARAQAIRAVALELERLANHTGDLGALAGDVGFLPTMSFCGRLRGDFLNASAAVCGNRFGRGLVRPGGVRFDLNSSDAERLATKLEAALVGVEGATALLWRSASVMSRFDETGPVARRDAVELGLVGVAGRASGVDVDVRRDFPTGAYERARIPVAAAASGDVAARAQVRGQEIRNSGTFVLDQLRSLPEGELCTELGPLAPNAVAVSMVEGWRGEICHVVSTDGAGRIAHYKVVDPSFHNWPGLALALRNQAISDFPLCNKSFNLSYCGHDL